MKKHPNHPGASGPAFTGLSNARPETMALSEPPVDRSLLPFDPLEYIEHELPWSVHLDPDIGQ
jgi:arylsulfatase